MAKHKGKGSGNRRSSGRKSGGRSAGLGRGGGEHRPLRVGEMIRKELVDIFASGAIHDPAVQDAIITVTEVRPSKDLSHAVVFIAPLGGGEVEPLMAGLARCGGLIRSLLARRITLRHVPALDFKLDTSFETADRIGEILASPKVARDLEQNSDDS